MLWISLVSLANETRATVLPDTPLTTGVFTINCLACVRENISVTRQGYAAQCWSQMDTKHQSQRLFKLSRPKRQRYFHEHEEKIVCTRQQFNSSTDDSVCCCVNIINIETSSRCPEVGRKRRPPTKVHERERHVQRSQNERHQHSKITFFRTRLRAESSNVQTTENCH